MKPKDLKHPLPWSARRPLIQDRIFFVPNYYSAYDAFAFPSWEDPEVFGREGPVHVEFCSGNGAWIMEKALVHPHLLWIAVEKRFDRIRKLWAKAKNRALNNLFLVCGEAHTFTLHYMPSASVEEVYINFPDPWPKARHVKHRLMTKAFLDQLVRILKERGRVTFVTDSVPYCDTTLALFLSDQALLPSFPHPFYVQEMPGYGTSYFDALWRDLGHEIYYAQFVKKPS